MPTPLVCQEGSMKNAGHNRTLQIKYFFFFAYSPVTAAMNASALSAPMLNVNDLPVSLTYR